MKQIAVVWSCTEQKDHDDWVSASSSFSVERVGDEAGVGRLGMSV